MTEVNRADRSDRGDMTVSRFVAHDHADLLDLLPSLFGFQPEDSIIAIATYGPRRRFGFRLRMDVPRRSDAEMAAELATKHLKNNGADGAILIAVTEQDDSADAWMGHMHRLLGTIPVIDAVRTDGATMWPVGPDGAGWPEPYVASCSPAVVQAVLEGMQILPNRDALVERFAAVSGARAEEMERVTAAVLPQIVRDMGTTAPSELGPVGMARVDPIRKAFQLEGRLDDGDLATLAIWVSSLRVRDEIWSGMTCGNAHEALQLWTTVAQSVVEPFAPAVLCLASFAA